MTEKRLMGLEITNILFLKLDSQRMSSFISLVYEFIYFISYFIRMMILKVLKKVSININNTVLLQIAPSFLSKH